MKISLTSIASIASIASLRSIASTSFLIALVYVIIEYPNYVLDYISQTINYMLFKIKPKIFKKRYHIAKANIEKVFPNKSASEVEEILYVSMQIQILNLLVGLCGQLLYKYTNYHKSLNYIVPEELKEDRKKDGILIIMSHYGIFCNIGIYGGSILNHRTYMLSNKTMIKNKLIYPKDIYKNIVFVSTEVNDVIIFNKLSKMNKQHSIIMLCDQRANRSTIEVNFLNQVTTFHTSPISIMKTSKRKIWSCHVSYDSKKKETNITFEKVIINKESNQESTQEIANHLSKKIIVNPNQYSWHYNRFKDIN